MPRAWVVPVNCTNRKDSCVRLRMSSRGIGEGGLKPKPNHNPNPNPNPNPKTKPNPKKRKSYVAVFPIGMI